MILLPAGKVLQDKSTFTFFDFVHDFIPSLSLKETAHKKAGKYNDIFLSRS